MPQMIAPRRASYADGLAAPPHLIAEVIDGVLHTQPRPATPHMLASSALGEELGPPFRRGRGKPGGWLLLDEPELHLGPEPDIVVPDLAGWRRERMPELPDAPYLTLVPDWACEALPPGTLALDRARKLPLYARERIPHVWLVDPLAQTLEVYRLDGHTYRLVATHGGAAAVRAEPFDAIELELGALWAR
jgi:Uma2 family endonuclease